MRTEIRRYSLVLIPETPQDEVWLETVLGLKSESDTATVHRVNAVSLSCWAYAELRKNEPRYVPAQ